jgi:predicted membrane chloride channel (bestrophin family)
MLTLVNILVVFFILLIIYQILLANKVVEGLENTGSYRPYDTNNPANTLILAQQNAGNIEYLKGRIEDIQSMSLYKQVDDLSGNVLTLQEQVGGLVTAQKAYANQLTGGVAPDITGATPEQPDETSDLVT